MNAGGAYARLRRLLTVAAGELRKLEQPAMVAACPNKFDDTGRYPDWLAVQVGRATWERTDYFGEGGDTLVDARNPDAVAAARSMLTHLQNAGWRQLVEQARDTSFSDEVLALVVQHNAAWLVVSASNAGQDRAFLVDEEGYLTQVGEVSRIDQQLGEDRLLLLNRIEPAAWNDLHLMAPDFPVSGGAGPSDPEAAASLAAALQEALVALRSVPGPLRYVAASEWDPYDGYSVPRPWRAVATAAASREQRSTWGQASRPTDGGHDAGELATLDRVLNQLETRMWRKLFAHALGRERARPSRSGALAILCRGSEQWLIEQQTNVFSLTDAGEIRLAGASEPIISGRDAAQRGVFLFSGRSFVPTV